MCDIDAISTFVQILQHFLAIIQVLDPEVVIPSFTITFNC